MTLSLHRLLLVTALLSMSVTAQAGLIEEAQALILAGKSRDAYVLLNSGIDGHAGNPDFDYLLGISALDAGHPAEAVFALERVLDLEPQNSEARAELARAYFQLGESQAAKDEFIKVKEQGVPAEVRQTIDHYLSAIEHRFHQGRTRYDIYIESGFGYDSNANSASDTSTVAVPALGNLVFTLDPGSQEQDSAVWDLATGMQFSSPYMQNLNIFGGINFNHRIPFHASDFDTRTADGVVGLHWLKNEDQFRFSVQGQRFFIDGNTNRNLGGFNAQWQRDLSGTDQMTAFVQMAAQRFPGQEVRNVNSMTLGLGWGHAFSGESKKVIFGSLYGGEDYELNELREDLGRYFVGVRVGGQYQLTSRYIAFASISYQYSQYGGDDPLFLKTRKDHYVNASIGTNYNIDSNWSLKPELRYSYNDSTLPVNDYKRFEAMLTVRNQF